MERKKICVVAIATNKKTEKCVYCYQRQTIRVFYARGVSKQYLF